MLTVPLHQSEKSSETELKMMTPMTTDVQAIASETLVSSGESEPEISEHRRDPSEIASTSPQKPNVLTSTFEDDNDLEDVSDVISNIPTTTKLYAGKTRDADLDEMLEIDMDDPRIKSITKRGANEKTDSCEASNFRKDEESICCIP